MLSRAKTLLGDSRVDELTRMNICIIGMGALGCAYADQLIRLGVKNFIIVDQDIVETSNLGRQTLYAQGDIHQLKVFAARDRLLSIATDTQINCYPEHVTVDSLNDILQAHPIDLIIDGTDNFHTRFVINQLSLKYQIPWLYSACIGRKGTVIPFFNNDRCLHCLFDYVPNTEDTCSTVGIIPPTVQFVVSIGVQLIIDNDHSDNMYYIDRLNLTKLPIPNRREDCVSCHDGNFSYMEQSTDHIIKRCGDNIFELSHTKMIQSIERHQVGDIWITLFPNGRVMCHGARSGDEATRALSSIKSKE